MGCPGRSVHTDGNRRSSVMSLATSTMPSRPSKRTNGLTSLNRPRTLRLFPQCVVVVPDAERRPVLAVRIKSFSRKTRNPRGAAYATH